MSEPQLRAAFESWYEQKTPIDKNADGYLYPRTQFAWEAFKQGAEAAGCKPVDIEAQFNRYFEFPEGSDRHTVTSTSCKLFARYCLDLAQ